MSKTHQKNKSSHKPQRRTTFKKHPKKYLKVYSPYLPAIIIFGLAATIWLSVVQGGANAGVLSLGTPPNNQSLLEATNEHRTSEGSDLLSLNSKLSKAAQAKAEDMVERNYWSHTNPEGEEPWIFIEKQGYKYAKASENLAYGFKTSESIVNGWINSPAHHKALIDKNVQEVGFGIADSQNFQNQGPETIVVALYAKPVSAQSSSALSLNTSSSEPVAISSAQTLTGGNLPWINFVVGLILGLGVMYLVLRHGLALRKKIRKGESYIIHHPVFDATMLSIVILCVVVMQGAGYIN